ncbi:hypothetical protein [Mesorhizobium sp.]|uniref:hypothetical protein n=1 Tax=Mesorhizobium sp. TaxID=1871066 RepID=UPI00121C35CC|nr:hypothetical protein [Mesorhizobium sp.]TIL33923.1 MAG: hypothetical protein E5Y85_12080 [Mesorhizobium sp.]
MGAYLAVAASFALDFEPMSLDRMIRAADLVAVGSIESVSKDRFTLRLTEPIAAPESSGSVTIHRNKDWSGDDGPGVYREGELVLVFAEKAKANAVAGSPPWRVLGFENEGVLPIDGEHVYYAGSTLEGFEAETYDVDGAEFTAYQFELPDFVAAVRAHRDCFGRAPARDEEAPGKSGVLCSESELKEYRDNTTLGAYLIRQAKGE